MTRKINERLQNMCNTIGNEEITVMERFLHSSEHSVYGYIRG